MAKKFWLKFDEHFFEQDEIIYLDSRTNGDKYIKIWLKLLLKCLRSEGNEGFLRFNEFIPYDENLLAEVLREDVDHIKAALREFLKIGMIEILEDGTIYVECIQKLIGKESDSTERVRKFRERKKQLQLDDKTQCNTEAQHETECNKRNVTCNNNIDIEVKKNKKENKAKKKRLSFDFTDKIKFNEFVFLTQTEYDRLVEEYGKPLITEYIHRLDYYMTNRDDKRPDGANRYLDHNRVIREWMRKSNEKKKQPEGEMDARQYMNKIISDYRGNK